VLIVEDEPYMVDATALRKRLGEPGIIATAPGVGYRIDTGAEGQDRG
jgi:two-component system response regulator VanR